jgi:VWFA-related protein
MSLSCRAWIVLLCCPVFALAQQPASQQPTPTQAQPGAKGPVLQPRPAPAPDSAAGQVQLDVLVEAKPGAPVSALEQKDFTILDDKKPQNILSFQAVDSFPTASAQEVQVVLLLDLVNSPFEQTAIIQQQIVKYLQQNGGHLPYPTSVAIFSKDGLRLQPTPSTDGNHLAAQLNATIRVVGPAPVSLGQVERFQLSLATLLSIAENEAKSPARKLLIWTGPGWPMLAGSKYTSSSQDRQRDFDAIVAVSTQLREAHIALYSISSTSQAQLATPGLPPGGIPYGMPAAEAPQQTRITPNMTTPAEGTSYKEFLKGVKSSKQADAGYLALQVLAVQSGGRVLAPNNDLAGQIASCIGDLSPFYRISFTPPHADHPDDYHELRVEIAKPGLTAHTNAGFYNQPQNSQP